MPLKCDIEKTENNGGKPLWYKVKKNQLRAHKINTKHSNDRGKFVAFITCA